MEQEEQPLTEEKAEDLVRTLMARNANIQSFFTDVIKSKSTTKTGNLTIDELGMPRITQRGIQELALFTKGTFIDKGWSDYFESLAEIQTATSLSKDAKLINLVVTNKKELADTTPERKKNSGMFGFGKKKEE